MELPMRHSLTLVLVSGFAMSAIAQTPAITTVVNGASVASGAIAPREAVAVFGTNIGPTTLIAANAAPYPTALGGYSVLVNGKAAPLFYVSAGQVNFQAPVDLSGASATIQVTGQVNGQTLQSAVMTVPVAPTAPGLYTTAGNIGQFLGQSGDTISATNPAKPGETVVIYATGFGATNPAGTSGIAPPANAQLLASVSMTVGGQPVTALYAGPAPGFVGIDQVNFTVPATAASGNLPVVVTVGGQASNSAVLPVGTFPTITGVSNNASGAPGIESGSWVSIYGANLSATTRTWLASDFVGNNLPTTLDNVRVTIDGKNAAIYYISPVQLNVQAPTDTAVGTVQVQVTNSYGTGTATATLQTDAPGFFPLPGAKYAAAQHASDYVDVAPAGYFGAALASRPAQPGEFILIYGTGFGPTTPAVPAGQIVSGAAPISNPGQLVVTIGGIPATVQFAGITAAGVYQFNVVVPQLANGDQPLLANINGVTSQTGLFIPIQN
jgi:uncharacterized protein (TIGR03437 family)